MVNAKINKKSNKVIKKLTIKTIWFLKTLTINLKISKRLRIKAKKDLNVFKQKLKMTFKHFQTYLIADKTHKNICHMAYLITIYGKINLKKRTH